MPDAPFPLSYCGAPPVPGGLWQQWNLDPVLIAALLLVAAGYAWGWREHRKMRAQSGPGPGRAAAEPGRREACLFAGGWTFAALALVSPLCSLSVALFSARVGQHMILMLIAAPLIMLGRPERVLGLAAARLGLRLGTGIRMLGGLAASGGAAWAAFAFFIWFWHAPGPYAATFTSDTVYWVMHLSLFGSALLLWRSLLVRETVGQAAALLIGLTTSLHMGLLGAIITLAPSPLYEPHATTTLPWSFTPLADQQLGGLIMWVPGGGLFLLAGLASAMVLLRFLADEQAPVHENRAVQN